VRASSSSPRERSRALDVVTRVARGRSRGLIPQSYPAFVFASRRASSRVVEASTRSVVARASHDRTPRAVASRAVASVVVL